MGRRPCCEKGEMNSGAWTAEEDRILIDYIKVHGEGRWGSVPKKAGLNRFGKSCRFRWLKYLRPDIKRGNISPDEEDLILRLHKLLGNRWSLIAGRLPGRTDNEIKNYWNTILCKRAQDKNRKLNAPKLRHYPDKSEGKTKLKPQENDNTFENPCNPAQPPVLEREPSVSLAAFWAATLKRSKVDINRQLSIQQDEDDSYCFGITDGGPRPSPPVDGETSQGNLTSVEVEKNGDAIGLFSRFSQGVELGENAVEDPVMDFDVGDIYLSDLLDSELLVGNNLSSTPSDPRLAVTYNELMVQDWNILTDYEAPNHTIQPSSSLFLFDSPEWECYKREQDK